MGGSPLGLPRASDRLNLNQKRALEFEIPFEKEYDRGVGSKGEHNPPLKLRVPDFDTQGFLDFIRKEASKSDIDDAAMSIAEQQPELLRQFQASANEAALTENEQGLPLIAPALWEERSSGREVSPADFVRIHYEPWLGNGLTRAHLGKLDEKLYAAYARQISRSPDKALKELPSEPRQKRVDPEEALQRIRDQTRASVAKHRNGM